MHATNAANTNYGIYGNLALSPEGVQDYSPRLRVIPGGRTARPQQADPFAHVIRESAPMFSARQQLVAFAAVALMTLSLLAAICLADTLSASRSVSAQDFATTSIAVHEGDTLWGIAEEHAVSGMSTQDVIGWIKDANNISSASLMVGQQLIVPLA